MRNNFKLFVVTLIFITASGFADQLFGVDPGKAFADVSRADTKEANQISTLRLSNDILSAQWICEDGKLMLSEFENKLTGQKLDTNLQPAICYEIEGTGLISSISGLTMTADPEMFLITGLSSASRQADRVDGKGLSMEFVSLDGKVKLKWSAVLRDNSTYIRQIITYTAVENIYIKKFVTEVFPVDSIISGTVDGSPVINDSIFGGCEAPMSVAVKSAKGISCEFPRATSFLSGENFTVSSVLGIVPKGQMRRGFNAYLEAERAHPYRSFLHYNSWFDLSWGYSLGMSEKSYMEALTQFEKELIQKRGVKMQGFVADDGWDEVTRLWAFNDRFPDGFKPHVEIAKRNQAVLGAWVSPWGGYGETKEARMKAGKAQGFELNANGFSMAGPKYQARFEEICTDMMVNQGVGYFKFDGVGAGNGTAGANKFEKDIDGLLTVISNLRQKNPELYINATVGTWPSPFWLMHADSIWRAGGDSNETNSRETWITYRDVQVYKNVVQRSPLFPISGLMVHGILFAKEGQPAKYDRKIESFTNEVRSYFASGLSLREMYFTPSLLKPEHWDALAEAAKWAEGKESLFIDTHWIGGNPDKKEIYGWSGWNNNDGYLALRNPSGTKKTIELDIGAAFQLPYGAKTEYILKSAFADNSTEIEVKSGVPIKITLKANEVLLLDVKK